MRLDATIASNFARIALGHVTRPFPYKMDHVLQGDDDARQRPALILPSAFVGLPRVPGDRRDLGLSGP